MTIPSYFAVIPADVRYCKNLEPNAKLLFGEITCLTQKEGFCWASNHYFAELYDVCERTVTNWLQSLEENGFIEVHTQKVGMRWDRKIFIIKEMFTKGKKLPDRQENNFPIEGKKTSTEEKQDSNNIKQQHDAAASLKIYECLDSVNIPQRDKIEITERNLEANVKKAIAWATHPETKINKTLAQAIKWACLNEPEAPKNKGAEVEQNKAYAKQQEAQYQNGIRVECLNKHVEIVCTQSRKTPDCIEYTEKGFKEQLDNALRKSNITPR
jgi:hypothetical protein